MTPDRARNFQSDRATRRRRRLGNNATAGINWTRNEITNGRTSFTTSVERHGQAPKRTAAPTKEEDAVRLYRGMSLQRILDNRMLALQRQGRIGFYGPSLGQEAAIVGAAMAMEPEDWIVPQYREPGAALIRGMPLKELLCQLIGNAEDPVH